MKKLIIWSKQNIFGVIVLFLLLFIPLFPKLPLVDIKNTWVYVRAEDFLVLGTLILSAMLLIKRKISLRTPLTVPILVYWLIGAIATIHGIMLIFPTLANVFPNVAFLSFLRRIEYMSLFFVGYWSVRDKQFLRPVTIVLVVTLLLTSLYGIGQKYAGLPAFLTMNEEFAKGVPIHLSALSRVPSTFAGHYDFAAYLALMIPIALALAFGATQWLVRIVIFGIVGFATYLMFTTVSRISFFALFVGVGMVTFAYNKRLILMAIPLLCISGYIFFRYTPLLDRYLSTVKEVQVLIDATNGNPIGHIAFVPSMYFQDKIVKQQFLKSPSDTKTISSSSALFIIPSTHIPDGEPLLTQSSVLTGEVLPQGTGYINLSLSPVVKKLNQFFYEQDTGEVQIINGSYLIKRTLAYDLSYTTRFQGEWPNALSAFRKNILVGSGYGSVSLAVDSSYIRMLGEVGIAGFVAFMSLFIFMGIYIRAIWPSIDTPLVKSFVIGITGGFAGLIVNAFFIDVFEASKIAFLFWMLAGITIGTLGFYKKGNVDVFRSFVKVVCSDWAIVLYIITLGCVLYSKLSGNYFVGDDFTWFRWASEGKLDWQTVSSYFTNAAGFFYRPGAKLYYLFMYQTFWLNQTIYHTVSIVLHIFAAILTYFLAKRIFSTKILAACAAGLFLLMSGATEAVFWVSATGILFASVLTLSALLVYMRGNVALAMLLALFAPLFHELGIVAPLLMFVWKRNYLILLIIPVYLIARYGAGSHWLSGDYNYNLLKLPFNVLGNGIGYVMMIAGGPTFEHIVGLFRQLLRSHLALGAVALVGIGIVGLRYLKFTRITRFCTLFIVISLLPFLGLGNMSSRYGYLAAVGVAMLLTYLGQKIYVYLLDNGKAIALGMMTLFISIFALFHIISLSALHDNWQEAGSKVERFITSIDGAYEDTWSSTPLELHFVGTPIRNGEAWVFPVGIPDILWFQFHNPDIRVFQESSVDTAFQNVTYGSATQKIFVFDEIGQVIEVKKPRSLP